jgi:uncharacterized coiled-coil protein SlyX
MDTSLTDLHSAYDGISTGITGMESAVAAQKEALSRMEALVPILRSTLASMNGSVVDMIPASVRATIPQSVLDQLATVKDVDGLKAKIAELQAAISSLETKISQMTAAKSGIEQGILGMQGALAVEQVKLAQYEAALSTATVGSPEYIDLQSKILGTNAHGVVLKYAESMSEYPEVMKKIAQVKGVIGQTPFILNEVMISSEGNISGVMIKGIDPKTVGSVTDLPSYMISGKLESLEKPSEIQRAFPGDVEPKEAPAAPASLD